MLRNGKEVQRHKRLKQVEGGRPCGSLSHLEAERTGGFVSAGCSWRTSWDVSSGGVAETVVVPADVADPVLPAVGRGTA